MFEIGDYVVFCLDGVCTIEAIGPLDMEGVSKDKLYYTLAPVGKIGNNRIFAPVESKRVVMRKIITLDEANELISVINDIEPLEVTDDKKREETYKAVLQSCDCVRIVQLIKGIYARKVARYAAGKKLPAIDERYFGMAENSLYGELAFPLKLNKDEVRDFIIEASGGDVKAIIE